MAGGTNAISASVGPRPAGMGGAQVADPVDASAFYYNVAGLARIEGGFLQLGGGAIIPKAEYQRLGVGRFIESEDTILPSPFGGFGIHLNDRLAFGLGWHLRGGMGSRYDEKDFPWQEGMLGLMEVVPALALKVNDRLYVGVKLDIGYAQFKNAGDLQLGSTLISPVEMAVEASGIGVGFGVAALYEVSERFALGISYTSPLDVKMKGSTKLKLLDIPLGEYETEVAANFAGRLAVGVKVKPNDWLTLLFDATGYDYSGMKELTAKIGPINYSQKVNWHDNFTLNAGAEIEVTEELLTRLGLCWHTAAIPRATTMPTAPEVAGPGVSFGFGYQPKGRSWILDLGYAHGWGEREVENHRGFIAPGKYRVDVDVLWLSVNWKFGGGGKDK
jgi:long-chain fatty acid transport protein